MMFSRENLPRSIGDNVKSHAPSVAWPIISRAWLVMSSKADKFPLETEPVAHDNNTILTLKLGPDCSKPD